jgi:hypothetical protein
VSILSLKIINKFDKKLPFILYTCSNLLKKLNIQTGPSDPSLGIVNCFDNNYKLLFGNIIYDLLLFCWVEIFFNCFDSIMKLFKFYHFCTLQRLWVSEKLCPW